MKRCTLAGVLIAVGLLTSAHASAAAGVNTAVDDATLFRLFLKDGTTLVSYGEVARVEDRVVFSMPTGPTGPAAPTGVADANPPLHLVNIAADRVDWDRTDRYAEAARASHYIATQADADYAAISNQIAQTLNEVATAPDAARRLALVERARKALAEWPRNHFNYRAAEVRQMLTLLDEAIADLRAASGSSRFDLSLTAYSDESPALEKLLPPPTLQDAIEQTLFAARISDSAAERESLLEAALTTLTAADADTAVPSDWVVATRAETRAALEMERQIDQRYQLLSQRMLAQGERQMRQADVRGLQQTLDVIDRRDAVLGRKRRDEINALVAAVQAQLDAARQFRLARDRWALREPEYRRYRAAISAPVDLLALVARMKPALESIKTLAGTSPAALAAVHRGVAQIITRASAIAPPEEFRAAHALIVSAAQMADTAAHIRLEATLSIDMARAWDASSAAAGALMLAARAASEIESLMRPPQLR